MINIDENHFILILAIAMFGSYGIGIIVTWFTMRKKA